jgi:hypothetical protein
VKAYSWRGWDTALSKIILVILACVAGALFVDTLGEIGNIISKSFDYERWYNISLLAYLFMIGYYVMKDKI